MVLGFVVYEELDEVKLGSKSEARLCWEARIIRVK